jgi:MtrB/PioB family decaheme-associated outer membrane protein
MSARRSILCLALAAPLAAMAQEAPPGDFYFGYLYVDDPNGKFGEYNGLDDDEHSLVFGLDWLWRDDEAPERYLDVRAHNVGLETYFLKAEQGVQGNYRVRLGYDQLQKVWHEDAVTVWDDDLERLDEPREITTKSKRKAWNIGFDKLFGANWELRTDYRDEDKTGQRSKPVNGGRIVPARLDFNHKQVNASLTWATRKAQVVFGGYVSEFENANDLVLNTAAVPDNEYTHFSVNGGYNTDRAGRFTGFLGHAEGEQNDPFSRYGIDPGTYAADSLNGEFDVTQLRLGWRKRFSRRFDMDAGWWSDKRDSDTPLYDDFPSDKNNKVYEWEKDRLFMKGRYRLPARWRMLAGLEQRDNEYERHMAPRGTGRPPERAAELKDETDETTAWGELRSPVINGFFGSLKYAISDRDVDLDPARLEGATDPGSGGVALSHYLLPRDRDRLDLTLTWSVNEVFTVGLLYSDISDDYDPVTWAQLDQVDQSTVTLDLGFDLTEDWTLTAYLGSEEYEVDQSGFGNRSNEESRWAYDIEDEGRFAGLSARGKGFRDQVDFRFEYRYYEGEGSYETIDPSNVSGIFPDMTTEIHTLSLRADWTLSPRWQMNLGWLYEDYDSQRWPWRQDFGEPGDTYFDQISYGYDTPKYRTHIIMVAGTLRF